MPDNLNLPEPPQSWKNMHNIYSPTTSFDPVSAMDKLNQELNASGGKHCPRAPMVDGKSINGAATIYKPTGSLTASGLPYGSGVAMAPYYLGAFPYGSDIRVKNLTTGKTVVTKVADTGNFGPGKKYPNYGSYTRVIDLPYNLARQLGVTGTSIVEITSI